MLVAGEPHHDIPLRGGGIGLREGPSRRQEQQCGERTNDAIQSVVNAVILLLSLFTRSSDYLELTFVGPP